MLLVLVVSGDEAWTLVFDDDDHHGAADVMAIRFEDHRVVSVSGLTPLGVPVLRFVLEIHRPSAPDEDPNRQPQRRRREEHHHD